MCVGRPVYEKERNVNQVVERWVWIPDASTCRIKIAHPTKLNQYGQYLMTRANLDWLADPAPGGVSRLERVYTTERALYG